MKTDYLFTSKRMKGLWKVLSASSVPIVRSYNKKELTLVLEQLEKQIQNNDYLPSVPYGYLGLPKGEGVTRFLPIIKENDLLVFYSLTLALQDFLVSSLPGVFGGYRVVPPKAKKEIFNSTNLKDIKDKSITSISDFDWGYGFGNTMAQKAWFKDWQQYTSFLEEAINDVPSHYKLITTDIANFYDTINIDKLSNKITRRLSKGGADEGFFDIQDMLITFLRYWDRRLNGYLASSKGIPQEIVTDASRILANFYLNDFDVKFSEYCKLNKLVYTRWADDVVVFGPSIKKLEEAIHKASRYLINDGLNLNSSKTKIYSKSKFVSYRGLEIINTINEGKKYKIDKVIKKLQKTLVTKTPVRNDTIFKRMLTFAVQHPDACTKSVHAYLDDCSKNYSLVSGLHSHQLFKLISISDEPKVELRRLTKLLVSKPYAGPKAVLLQLLWKSRVGLKKIGMTDKDLKWVILQVKAASEDSEIILNICVPKASSMIV